MKCNEKIEDHSYEFFDNISNYMKDGKTIEDNSSSAEASNQCDSFSNARASDLGGKENAKNICVLFTKLYNYLPNIKKRQNTDANYKKDCELLNYWLNFKLNDGKINGNTCVSGLINYIETYCNDVFRVDTLDFLYDIKKDDLHKMNILYSLYQNYSKLKNIIENKSGSEKPSLLPHSTACCADYIEAKYICNGGNNNSSTFCKKLRTFESKYEQLYQEFDGKRSQFSDYLIKLEECGNNKIITTAITGTFVGLIPLLGVLYKFTPMGQVLRSKMGILNNDDEITNVSLMEQENEQLRLQKGKYNIKYQSL